MQLTHVDQSHWDFRSIGAAHGQMGIFTAIWFFSRPYGVFHGHVFFFTAILGCHGHMLKRLMAGEEAIKQPSRMVENITKPTQESFSSMDLVIM